MRHAACVAFVVVGVLGSPACGPSDACRRYVACQQASDPTVSTAAWDDGGSCWTGLQTADACTAQCRAALEALAELPEAPAACVEGAAALAGSG